MGNRELNDNTKILCREYGIPMSPVEHARPILESKNLESIGVTLGTTFIILRHLFGR